LLAATVVVLFLIAWLPYMININTSRDIRRKAILSERSRLSREMHDGLAQSLGILHLRVGQLRQTVADGKLSQALPQVNEVKGLIEEAQCQVRGAIDELRAGADNKERLFPALIRYTTEFTQTYGIMCELSMADGKVTLPLPAESELLSIAREALSNVGKHSAASAVDVTVESKKDCVEMTGRLFVKGMDCQ
jgi:signal transduction histidine kinase